MDDLTKEQTEGLDPSYMLEAINEKNASEGKHHIPFGKHFAGMVELLCETILRKTDKSDGEAVTIRLLGRTFSHISQFLEENLGREKSEEILKEVVETFGIERGRRIAAKVRSEEKTLTYKNFLIYSDMDLTSVAPDVAPDFKDGDLILDIPACAFNQGAREAGLLAYSRCYCRYIDKALMQGYNPDIQLDVVKNLSRGDDRCRFVYRTKSAGQGAGS
jgi:hypothetical protein